MIGKYVIVRSDKAGCFAGTLTAKDGSEVTMTGVRRLWYWAGAASLSQLATTGTSNPKACKFPPEVEEQIILGVDEILAVTDKAKKSIVGVEPWQI